MTTIFVYPSNLAGIANTEIIKHAIQYYGAQEGMGKGYGLSGNSFAIPVRDHQLRLLPLKEISTYIRRFLVFAATCELKSKGWVFMLNNIGYEENEYIISQIAPAFENARYLKNMIISKEMLKALTPKRVTSYERVKLRNDDILKDFNNGVTKTEIANKYHICFARISEIIKQSNIKDDKIRNKINTELKTEIKVRYFKQDIPKPIKPVLLKIAKEYGISYSAVYSIYQDREII